MLRRRRRADGVGSGGVFVFLVVGVWAEGRGVEGWFLCLGRCVWWGGSQGRRSGPRGRWLSGGRPGKIDAVVLIAARLLARSASRLRHLRRRGRHRNAHRPRCLAGPRRLQPVHPRRSRRREWPPSTGPPRSPPSPPANCPAQANRRSSAWPQASRPGPGHPRRRHHWPRRPQHPDPRQSYPPRLRPAQIFASPMTGPKVQRIIGPRLKQAGRYALDRQGSRRHRHPPPPAGHPPRRPDPDRSQPDNSRLTTPAR